LGAESKRTEDRVRFEEQLKKYFSSKARQILEAARKVGTEHNGLVGGHREVLVREYLAALLPRRYEVGRGMVYGLTHRSKEADLVVWDSQNYPSLRFRDHSNFFAESVRLVLEAKSNWSTNEFIDILEKCKAVRDIVPSHAPNLSDELAMLHLEVEALKQGKGHQGILRTSHHIATAALVLFGGATFGPEILDPAWIDDADDQWPDVLLLLERGKLVLKRYETHDGYMGGCGRLEFYDLGDDALLVFSAMLMERLAERTVVVEDPSFLLRYVHAVVPRADPAFVEFQPTRPVAQSRPLWNA
jgi:hypothetical protein